MEAKMVTTKAKETETFSKAVSRDWGKVCTAESQGFPTAKALAWVSNRVQSWDTAHTSSTLFQLTRKM